MSKTKGELVTGALSRIGISDFEFDIEADQITSGISVLDSMMAQLSAKGAIVSYPFGDLDADTDSNIPDTAEEAIITNLAIRLAPSYGKEPSMALLGTARTAMTALLSFSARPREIRFPQMPKGAGYKNNQWPFTTVTEDPNLDVVDNEVDLSGGPDDGT